jgi:hypothetical protein
MFLKRTEAKCPRSAFRCRQRATLNLQIPEGLDAVKASFKRSVIAGERVILSTIRPVSERPPATFKKRKAPSQSCLRNT